MFQHTWELMDSVLRKIKSDAGREIQPETLPAWTTRTLGSSPSQSPLFLDFQGKCLLAQPLAPSENSSPGTRLLSATGVDRGRAGRADGPQAAPLGRPWPAWPCEYRW